MSPLPPHESGERVNVPASALKSEGWGGGHAGTGAKARAGTSSGAGVVAGLAEGVGATSRVTMSTRVQAPSPVPPSPPNQSHPQSPPRQEEQSRSHSMVDDAGWADLKAAGLSLKENAISFSNARYSCDASGRHHQLHLTTTHAHRRDTYLYEGRTDLQTKLAEAHARIQELEDHQYAYSTTYNFDTSGAERKKISGLERVLFSTLSRLKALLIQLDAVDAGRQRVEVIKSSVEQADGCVQIQRNLRPIYHVASALPLQHYRS